MIQDELRKEFAMLYNLMAESNDVKHMQTFGRVYKEIMEWLIANRPTEAQEWIGKLESIRWKNFLTPREAESIVVRMEPRAPWTREQWSTAMQQAGYELEREPYYNRCALWVTMCMIMSDSASTLGKYVDGSSIFKAVHDLAVDKLTDKDGVFSVRKYFGV